MTREDEEMAHPHGSNHHFVQRIDEQAARHSTLSVQTRKPPERSGVHTGYCSGQKGKMAPFAGRDR